MLMEISMRLRQEAIKMGYEFRFGGEIYQEDGIEYLVEMEPETFDVCNPEWTDHPKDAVRPSHYGSGIAEFIRENLPKIGAVLDEERSILPVSIVIDEINNLKSVAPEGEEAPELYNDRVRWFQYWANKCLRLYGEEAKFQIS